MCFAAMVQLSFGLRDYTDDIIQTMMIMIGLILSFSILFLSLGIVVSESRETLALMKAFGYTDRECQSHILAPIVLGLSRICFWDSLSIWHHGNLDRCDQRHGS